MFEKVAGVYVLPGARWRWRGGGAGGGYGDAGYNRLFRLQL